MAKDICLDTRVMEQIADRLAALASNMDSLGGRLGNIHLPEEAGGTLRLPVSVRLKSTGGSYGGSGNLNATLRNLASGLRALGNSTDRASDQIQAAADDLADLERTMARMYQGDNLPEIWKQRPLGGDGAVGAKVDSTSVFAVEYEKIGLFVSQTSAVLNIGKFAFGYQKRLAPLFKKESYTVKYGNAFANSEEWLGLNPKVVEGKFKQKRPELGEKKADADKGTDYKQDISLLRVGKSFSESVGFDIVSGKWSNDKASLGAEVKASTAEAHATGNAGLYSYKVTADGKSKRVFAPGANVDIGASYTLLEGAASGEYELIDNVSVSSSVSAKAGHVSGKAKGEVGYVDGKWVAAGELSAEAIAGRVEGDVGVDVAGLKGKMGGSLDFGFGAHAKGGYKDGKFYFDVGASAGFGASVNVELDVSGLVDNVSKVADSFVDGTKKVLKGASKVVDGLIDFFS